MARKITRLVMSGISSEGWTKSYDGPLAEGFDTDSEQMDIAQTFIDELEHKLDSMIVHEIPQAEPNQFNNLSIDYISADGWEQTVTVTYIIWIEE